MKQHQEQLCVLLNDALFYNKKNYNEYKNYNWSEIFKEAKSHNILELVYGIATKVKLDNSLMNSIKRDVLVHCLNNITRFEDGKKILHLLHQNGVDIIILKGTQLRFLYPNPEYRTMSDIDILVKKESFNKVKDILIQEGYEANVDNGVHLQFIRRNSFPIEVHWRLTNENYIKNSVEFEKRVWRNKVEFNNYGFPLYVLSIEDNIVYLALHMIEHMLFSGFGIRQICDIALLINADIDWCKVVNYAQELKVEKFLFSILCICNRIFNSSIPKSIIEFSLCNKNNIDLLMDEIFDSGLYGGKTVTKIMAKKLSQYKINNTKENLRIFFPGTKIIYNEFPLSKKYKILIPIVWFIRAVNICLRKMTTFTLINYTRIRSGESLSVKKAYQQRVKLIKWLEIKNQ